MIRSDNQCYLTFKSYLMNITLMKILGGGQCFKNMIKRKLTLRGGDENFFGKNAGGGRVKIFSFHPIQAPYKAKWNSSQSNKWLHINDQLL